MFKHDSGHRPLNGITYSQAKWEDLKIALTSQATREELQRKAQREQ